MIQTLAGSFSPRSSDIFGAEETERVGASHVQQRVPKIVIAEDDREMRRYLAEKFRKFDYDVVEAEDGTGVLGYVATGLIVGDGQDVDLVISDIRMPGTDGLRLLSALRSIRRDLPVVLITAFGNPVTHEEALLRGARAVINKPFEFDELLAVVRRLLEPGTTRTETQS